MRDDVRDATTQERIQIHGTDAHVDVIEAVTGLDAETAGRQVDGFPRTIHEVLGHMTYWLEVALARIGGTNEGTENQDASWLAGPRPADETAWQATVTRFVSGLGQLEEHVASMQGDPCTVRNVRMVEGHNSYHTGQIIALRRMLGAWPPPGGAPRW